MYNSKEDRIFAHYNMDNPINYIHASNKSKIKMNLENTKCNNITSESSFEEILVSVLEETL